MLRIVTNKLPTMRRVIVKQILLALFTLLMCNQVGLAVKAYPYPCEITQPDGTKLTVVKMGDEHLKWAQTVDGYSILKNSIGIYEYTTLDQNNNMILSGVKAKNFKERSVVDNLFLSKIKKGIVYSKSQIAVKRSKSTNIQKSSMKTFPSTGSRKLLCILIGFADKAFTKTQTEFNNLFNQIGYSTDGAYGSVKDYYLENSYNQLDLTITVAGPYQAAYNMAYYGANDADGWDVKPDVLVREALSKADPNVNFADYDNDNNGVVDGVYVIYAGYGEEVVGVDENAIWAHAGTISPVSYDGKIINSYSCSSEFRSNSGTNITRIGVICHEFGHVIGAPDFYDTDYEENGGEYDGTGKWDLMSDGEWNAYGAAPAHHNPYTKIYIYNWATATTLSTAGTITLYNAAENSNSFYRINTTTTNEYFLIENRQSVKFDAMLPGNGMLIYHVDGSYITQHTDANDINVKSHQGLYIVCASATGNPPTDYGSINSTGCPYPGSSSKMSFSDYTTPNSKSWAGALTNKPISNISENTTTKTVTFTIANTTDVHEEGVISTNFLGQNYPNPFNLGTQFDFSIQEQGQTTITIYNAVGKEIDKCINENLSPGSYTRTWTPKDIPSGIYFYQINAKGYKETKRLIYKK